MHLVIGALHLLVHEGAADCVFLQVDNPITGTIHVTIDWQPPQQLGCHIHDATDLLSCQDILLSTGRLPRRRYVVLCYLSETEQVDVSDVRWLGL